MTKSSTPGGRAGRWLLMFLAVTVLALYSFAVYTTTALADRTKPNYARILTQELTGFYALLILLPAILWFMRRYPLERGTLLRRLPLHQAATVVGGVTCTFLMWGSRTLLFPILGFGAYDYGRVGIRFLMEYQKQVILYWALFAVITLLETQRKNREKEVQASLLQRQLAEARLNALRMQLNPHFLFNTLNMISSYVHQDPGTADRMIASLSDLLRLTLKQAESQEVTLEKELEFLDAYLAIMKARFHEQIEVRIDVEPSTRGLFVPSVLLQPLVENFVKHCMENSARPGRVRIASSWNGDRLKLEVEDNGTGIAAEVEGAPDGGVGLSNMRQRLQQLYGESQKIDIANVPGAGLRVTIEIPVRGQPRETAAL